MIAIEQKETWVSPIEIRDLFDGTPYGKDGYGADLYTGSTITIKKGEIPESLKADLAPEQPVEVDEELGLAIVPRETILSKYGVQLYPSENTFHQSLTTFFERKGYLTPKQLKAI